MLRPSILVRLTVKYAVTCFGLALVCAGGIGTSMAQQQDAIELPIQDWKLYEHQIAPQGIIRLGAAEYHALPIGRESIQLEIVVSESGRVESANVVGEVRTHADEAIAIEQSREFKPWTRDGMPIRIKLRDDVMLYPPEQWMEPRVPFPEPWDLSGVSLQLKRTRCYGPCPVYDVTISGNGTVHFHGDTIGVLIPGDHVAHIATDAVRDLVRQFERADFFSAYNRYSSNVTDNPTQILTLTLAGRTKQVVDYVGLRSGLPSAINDLEAEVDRVAGTDRWIKGTDQTVPSLEAENWPLAADTDQNLRLYVTAISTHNQPLVDRYLAAHAPAASPNPKITSPVCSASETGDLSLVERVLQSAASAKQPLAKVVLQPWVADQCLASAALSGKIDVLQFWLDKGANPNAPPVKDNEDWLRELTPLAAAMMSGNPEVVRILLQHNADIHTPAHYNEPILEFALDRSGEHAPEIVTLLIQAGTDVNALDERDLPAIFSIEFVPSETIKSLLAGGADVNTRSIDGTTPLIRFSYREDIVRELLTNGADPTLANKSGQTALTTARETHCDACTALIEEALKKRANEGAPVQ